MIQWLPTVGGTRLAFLPDDPARPDQAFGEWLTPHETEDWRAKAAAPTGRHWLLGRLAAKAAAGSFWNLPPQAVEVRSGPEGRPEARPLGPARPPAWISISHTRGAALGAAGERPLGVDIERLDRGLGGRVQGWAFSEAEQALLTTAGAASPWPAALALWCAKEAAAKSWGRGLLNHVGRVRVTGADWPEGRLTVAWLEAEAPARAEARLTICGEYLLALAESGADRIGQE
jgi:4'-phosphopantetheinyl transferase